MQFLDGEIINNNSLAQNITSSIYKVFSATCRRYTDVMAHKHELQNLIFNSSSNLNVTVSITSLIIQLEYAAFRLESFAVRLLTISYNVYIICCELFTDAIF